MPRYKLTIEYDGTDFCGWQKQEPYAPLEPSPVQPSDNLPSRLPELRSVHPGTEVFAAAEDIGVREGETRSRVALRTVQHVVERAVREVVREPVILMGASRTDSGVHARGQVGAFTCSGDAADDPSGFPPARHDREESPPPELRGLGWPLSRGTDRLLRAINGRLPADVQIVAIEPTTHDFNPIGGATSKAYSYSLFVSPSPPVGLGLRPLWDRRYVQQIWGELNLSTMNEAAKRLVGEHDFAAFAAAGHGRLTTVRSVFTCGVTESPSERANERLLRIDVSGSGFLYNMVRIIAGTLVEVGRGKMKPDDVTSAIESKDRRNAGPTLPGTGLCLEWIKYAP